MPRYGDAESIQWFKADIGYSFHVLNAYDDGEEVGSPETCPGPLTSSSFEDAWR
jgi:carotenoid cleavage dioxygenase-like enzyme